LQHLDSNHANGLYAEFIITELEQLAKIWTQHRHNHAVEIVLNSIPKHLSEADFNKNYITLLLPSDFKFLPIVDSYCKTGVAEFRGSSLMATCSFDLRFLPA
jgi:hypothetical protein